MEVFFIILGLAIGVVIAWFAPRRIVVQTPRPESTPTEPVAIADHRIDEAREELERLRAALDALPVGVVYADQNGRVVVRNRIAEHAAGARHGDILVEEAIERNLAAAAVGETRDQALNLFGPPYRVLAIHTEPVASGGAIATISDITERSRLDAVRTDFVANISHELKTPVGAISLLAETLADADDAETLARLSGKLVKESERLARTIDDLLELSRIELGGDALREWVDARVVMEEAADRVRNVAETRNISLVVHPPQGRVSALGDRRQLVSALGNLADNAVKYSDNGAEVELSAVQDGEMVTFNVIDHGMGIAAQHLDRIFERFYRVDKARSRDTGGVGLGLAIVRHVAANHGGEVNVTSREGEGSTFKLRIPSAPDMMSARSITSHDDQAR